MQEEAVKRGSVREQRKKIREIHTSTQQRREGVRKENGKERDNTRRGNLKGREID